MYPSNVEEYVKAIDGYCPFNCDRQFSLLIGLLSTFSLLGSTGRLGNQLLSLRAVEPRDKAAGLIIMVSLLSLLVFLPSPLIVANIMGRSLEIEKHDSCCHQITPVSSGEATAER